MFVGLITIAGGILAASSLIVAREPDGDKLLATLTPAIGWIGVAMFFWGVWGTIDCVRDMALWSTVPMRWWLLTLTSAANLIVGFLLSFGLITQYSLSPTPEALAHGQAIRSKLIGYQALVGLVAVASGAAYTVLIVI